MFSTFEPDLASEASSASGNAKPRRSPKTPSSVRRLSRDDRSPTLLSAEPPADPRFWMYQTHWGHVELSRFANDLGHEFVAASCESVRKQKLDVDVGERTWRENYVLRLVDIFEALSMFRAQKRAGKAVADFCSEDWQDFGRAYRQRLDFRFNSGKTLSKLVSTANNVLGRLAFDGVIPFRIDLTEGDLRDRRRVGSATADAKGLNRKPKAVTVSPLIIVVEAHRRSYDFRRFLALAPCFMADVIKPLTQHLQRLPAGLAKSRYNALVNLFDCLASPDAQLILSKFLEKLASDNYRALESGDWEGALYHWRDSLHGPDVLRTKLTAQQIWTHVQKIWGHWVGASLVPAVSMKGIWQSKRLGQSKSKLSLAQLPHGPDREAVDAAVWDSVRRTFDETNEAEAREFISSLCQVHTAAGVRQMSPEEMIKAIHDLNTDGLRKARVAAEATFAYWRRHWEAGQQALQAATHSAAEQQRLFGTGCVGGQAEKRLSRKLFFQGESAVRLGNALNHLLAMHDGIVGGVKGRLHHLAIAHGGRGRFHAYLHPHEQATTALWILVMTDTGANAEVARVMPWDCLGALTNSGARRVKLGVKHRAKGHTIEDELPIVPPAGFKLSLIAAIEQYKEMAARINQMAEGKLKAYLMLQVTQGEIKEWTEFTARAWFIKFAHEHQAQMSIHARPCMLRPSFLLSFRHQHGDSLAAAQTVADHASPHTTYTSYANRTAERLANAERIRQFQTYFQTLIVASIDGAADKLRLTRDQFDRLFDEASNTGLGVACLDPRAGVQPGTSKGSPCDRLDACSGCEMRWIVATPPNVADLILFNEYLESVQEEEERERPEPWEKRWLPWLVFSRIALAKLRSGSTARVFVAGTAEADARRASYTAYPLY